MGKGLLRSRAAGAALARGFIKQQIPVNGKVAVITNGAPGFGTVVIGDFPQGNIVLLGCVADMVFTKGDADITDTWTGNYSLGTGPNADGTLSGTEVDIVPSTALNAATAGVSPRTKAMSGASQNGAVFDNTDGSLELNMNFIVADSAISADSSLICRGVVYLAYVVLGDD